MHLGIPGVLRAVRGEREAEEVELHIRRDARISGLISSICHDLEVHRSWPAYAHLGIPRAGLIILLLFTAASSVDSRDANQKTSMRGPQIPRCQARGRCSVQLLAWTHGPLFQGKLGEQDRLSRRTDENVTRVTRRRKHHWLG